MAKLYFYYSSMNAGKSTNLLQSSYNYRERGMHTLILAPQFDDRYGEGKVTSRIGIASDATTFTNDTDLLELVASANDEQKLHCVLIDEAQFLTRDHILPLSRGGGNSWENVVASCSPCNNRKGNRLPAEVGWPA